MRSIVLRFMPLVALLMIAVVAGMVAVGDVRHSDMIAFSGQDMRFDAGVSVADLESGLLHTFLVDDVQFILSRPVWSADGDHLYFAASNTAQNNLHDLHLVSGDIRPIIGPEHDLPMQVQDLSLSPDGKTVAFILAEAVSNQIYTISVDGANLTPIARVPEQLYTLPVWSPDGAQFAYLSRHWTNGYWEALHVADVTTGRTRQVTELPQDGAIMMPQWTDAGLLYGEMNLSTTTSDIYAFDPESGVERQILTDYAALGALITPYADSTTVALVTYVYPDDSGIPQAIVNLFQPETGDVTPIYTTKDIIVDSAWSIDGSALALEMVPVPTMGLQVLGLNAVVVIDAATGVERFRTPGQNPAWRP